MASKHQPSTFVLDACMQPRRASRISRRLRRRVRQARANRDPRPGFSRSASVRPDRQAQRRLRLAEKPGPRLVSGL